jgi:uncharacterized protein (TIGR02246 family)
MEDIEKIVADLDTRYQAAVKVNDAETMAAILHEDMILIRGNGGVLTRDEILTEARAGNIAYDVQDEENGTQKVRVLGPDTAVVTAKLRIKGKRRGGEGFDRTVWFSDTYVRAPSGWRYAFAQVSLPLPE